MPRVPNTNDGTDAAPRLRLDLNAGTLWNLPEWSAAPKGDERAQLRALAAFGFAGVQHIDPKLPLALGLPATGMGRVDKPDDADALARSHKELGLDATTLHVGTGLESDGEVDALVGAVIEAAAAHAYPLYIETHRATVTQDMRRTVDLIGRFPDIRFNADLSHWYTGHEMTYGDIDRKLGFIAPVLERVRFLHGRIGTSGCMQVPVGEADDGAHLDHFKEMWTRAFAGFLSSAAPGDFICFAPELLPASIPLGEQTFHLNYARLTAKTDGGREEESDRWQQALLLCEIARGCFAEAERRLEGGLGRSESRLSA